MEKMVFQAPTCVLLCSFTKPLAHKARPVLPKRKAIGHACGEQARLGEPREQGAEWWCLVPSVVGQSHHIRSSQWNPHVGVNIHTPRLFLYYTNLS